MKKFYTTLLLALVAMTVSAQDQKDTLDVAMDFTTNAWNIPYSAMKKNPGSVNTDDETGALWNGHTFKWKISDNSTEEVELVVSAYDDEFTYPSYYGRATNWYNEDSVFFCLCLKEGSRITLKAPPSYYIIKAYFYNYGMFGLGMGGVNLYHDSNNKGAHIWGKDSVKVSKTGNFIWSGDSTAAQFYAGNTTTLTKVLYRLLPRQGSSGITTMKMSDARQGEVLTIDGILLRRNGKLEGLRKGVYIVDGKKVVVK